jgi:hypothetical protein
MFRYDQVLPQLVFICVVNEQWIIEESIPVDSAEWYGSDGLWHLLCIRVQNDNLQALRDDEVILEYSDSLIGQLPQLGWIEISNTYLATCFDDILLVSLGEQGYICGDADGNDMVNISDAVYLIEYIFGGGPPPEPLLSGDVDCNQTVNISDAVYLISYIFSSGPAPCDPDGDGWTDC